MHSRTLVDSCGGPPVRGALELEELIRTPPLRSRSNPRYDKCRGCGHERVVPLENWDNPSPPFVGG